MTTHKQQCDFDQVAQNPSPPLLRPIKIGNETIDLNDRVHRQHPRLSAYHTVNCLCEHCATVIRNSKRSGEWHNERDREAVQIIDHLLNEEYYRITPQSCCLLTWLPITFLLLLVGALSITTLTMLQNFEESPVELYPSNTTTTTTTTKALSQMVGISVKGLAVRSFYEKFNACEREVMGHAGLTDNDGKTPGTRQDMFNFAGVVMTATILHIVVSFLMVMSSFIFIMRVRYEASPDYSPKWIPDWLSWMIYGGISRNLANEVREATVAGQSLVLVLYELEAENVQLHNEILVLNSKINDYMLGSNKRTL